MLHFTMNLLKLWNFSVGMLHYTLSPLFLENKLRAARKQDGVEAATGTTHDSQGVNQRSDMRRSLPHPHIRSSAEPGYVGLSRSVERGNEAGGASSTPPLPSKGWWRCNCTEMWYFVLIFSYYFRKIKWWILSSYNLAEIKLRRTKK